VKSQTERRADGRRNRPTDSQIDVNVTKVLENQQHQIQIDRQAGIQPERLTDRQKGRQIYRQTDRQIDR
jgi:hypothetical protein